MEDWTHQDWMKIKNRHGRTALYLYTPMCGTCRLAARMLSIVEEMKPGLPIGKANLNFAQDIAELYKVESVPCLLITENGDLKEKVYAFRSVPYLAEKIKSS
ncbi:thioredoxin family protein [Indiicoccus explosivorum]|uniref:thioredoxin family protein n=1 Tax=Indiicoccus explosivorum TaxID=1917864 RepID=UPI000B437799|nr:thioredoxin family protein [Indiicoccus explosivorum]